MLYTLLVYLLLAGSISSNGVGKDEAQKQAAERKLKEHAYSLREFAELHGASTKLVVLIDMSISPKKKRFFIVNLDNDSVILAGLCAHGSGHNPNNSEVVFSNEPGSGRTSEGRYR